jgi:hypothetical protein
MGFPGFHSKIASAVSTTAFRLALIVVALVGSAEMGRSQVITVDRYREVTPYRVEDLGKATWERSGRPGIFASEFTVPANSFLRTITLQMAASPNPRGGFQLHLFRIGKQGGGKALSHIARLSGTANPATAGSHAYRIPSGLAVSGHYLLVAAVSPGGGTYRWVIEPGSPSSPRTVYFGLLADTLVEWARSNTNSGNSGSSWIPGGNSTGSVSITTGATFNLGNDAGSGSQNHLVTSNSTAGNFPGAIGMLGVGTWTAGNLTLGGGTVTQANLGSNPSNPTPTIGGNSAQAFNNVIPQTIGTLSVTNPVQFNSPNPGISIPTGTQPTVNSLIISPLPPINLSLDPTRTLSISGSSGVVIPGSPEGPQASLAEREASAFLSSSSEVAAAETADVFDLSQAVLFVDPEETGQFRFTLEHGLTSGLVAVQRPKPFSPVPVGSEGPTQRIRIRNLAEASIPHLSIRATGETRRHFKITQVPSRSLEPGETTEFSITPRPSRPGSHRGLVEVRTSAGSEFVYVSVRGVEFSYSPRLVGAGE